MRNMAQRWRSRLFGFALLIVLLAVGTAIYLLTRSSDQPQVGADVLPVIAKAQRAAAYTDCSRVNSVAYFPGNPCQTFVLIESTRFRSAAAFLAAETRQMIASGWHHSAPQPVDYDGAYGNMASATQSWAARDHRACAYVASVRAGVSAETPEIFPRRSYDVPQGVYDFYRAAKAANPDETLWVRLRPPNTGGRCVG
jgi:hypothetical protein